MLSQVVRGTFGQAAFLVRETTKFTVKLAAAVLPTAVTDVAKRVASVCDPRSLTTGGAFVVQHLVTGSLKGSYFGIPALAASTATALVISEVVKAVIEDIVPVTEMEHLDSYLDGGALPVCINAPSIWIPDSYLAGATTLLSIATFGTGGGDDEPFYLLSATSAALYGSYALGGPLACLGASLLIFPILNVGEKVS